MNETPVIVRQGSRDYPVHIGSGVIDALDSLVESVAPGRDRVVVVAAPVAALYGERLRAAAGRGAAWIEFEDGEQKKTLASAESLIGRMLEAGVRRDHVALIAGGGVTGDAAGFAASIHLRGIDFVHVPTTLLAQVDSSIGGKLGVNHALGKNLIGSFGTPLAVVSDTSLLSTLHVEDLRSGLYEALKSGVIGDSALFDEIETFDPAAPFDATRLQSIVTRAVAVKGRIVSADERENGERRLLNYGHTIGHAIETALHYSGLTHGEAVAWGMIGMNALARERGSVSRPVADRIDAAILRLSPRRPAGLDRQELLRHIGYDKKFIGSRKLVVVPDDIGHCSVIEASADELRLAVDATLAAIAG